MSNNIPKIDISPEQWDIVRDILQKHVPQYQVWAFGSRAKWTAKPYSDLDLAIITDHPLDLAVSASLSDDFSESDLPWRVDLVDWAATSESFRGVIEGDKVVVQSLGWREFRNTSKVPFSYIAEVIMGQSPKSEEVNEIGLGLPLLNGPTEFTERYPTPVQYTEFAKKTSQPEDILFCVRGSTTGRMNYADQEYCIGRGLAAIRGKNGYPTPYIRAVLNQYLPFLLQGATGSTFPNVSKDLLNNINVNVLSIDDALRINAIIIALENKIYCNSSQNQTLEQMAQTLFKSWFVDFDPVIDNALDAGNTIPESLQQRAALRQKVRSQSDFKPLPDDIRQLFPNQFVESELGWVPEGWSYKCAEDVSYVAIGKTPPRNQPEWFCDQKQNNHVWVSIRDMGNAKAFIGDSSEYLVPEAIAKFNVKVVPRHTVILSFKLTLGRVCISRCDSVFVKVVVTPS